MDQPINTLEATPRICCTETRAVAGLFYAFNSFPYEKFDNQQQQIKKAPFIHP